MNKCPSCRSTNVNFVDSSENIQYEIPGSKHEFEEWEQYDCADCGALLEIENGYVSVKRAFGLEYKTVLRYSVDWEKRFEELFNN